MDYGLYTNIKKRIQKALITLSSLRRPKAQCGSSSVSVCDASSSASRKKEGKTVENEL